MATATVDLGLNTAEFSRGLSEAGRSASSFESKLGGLFRRSPMARAERAFDALAVGLSTGNVAQGVAAFGSRLTGLGLIAGVAIGAAVGIFEKFKAQVDEARKASENLNKELAKPIALTGALAPEGITAQIEALDKAEEDLAGKRNKLGSKAFEFFQRNFLTAIPGIQAGPTDREKQGSQISEALNREKQLQEARADAELRIVDARRLGLTVSKEDGELAGIALKAEQARAKLFIDRSLTRPGRDQSALFKSFIAGAQDEKLSTDETRRKFSLKRLEEDSEAKILDIKDKHLTKDQEAIEILKEKIQLKGKEAELEPTVEGQTSALLGARTASTELKGAQFGLFQRTGGNISQIVAERQANQFEHTIFDNRQKDLADRIKRGAYGQSREELELYGKLKAQVAEGPLTATQLDTILGKYWK